MIEETAIDKLVNKLRRPVFIHNLAFSPARDFPEGTPKQRSAQTRLENARKEIAEVVHGFVVAESGIETTTYRVRTKKFTYTFANLKSATVSRRSMIAYHVPDVGPVEAKTEHTYTVSTDWEPVEEEAS